MSRLQKLGDSRFRIVCDCGEYIHEISKGEKGLELESYFVAGKDSDEPAEDREKAPKEKPKKREKDFFDFLSGSNDEPEEGEDEND